MIFKCKNCGGNMVYSPEQGKMFCPHCDSVDSDERNDGTGAAECVNCGAELTVGQYNSTCKCEYCSSYYILNDRVSGEYRPDFAIPFKLGKKSVVELMNKEFASRIFTPDSFLSEASLEGMKGMYVPFWMYDYLAKCDYAGTGTKVRVWTSGDTEYTETSYYRVERNMDIDFDKIPVDASKEMKDEVMDLMEPYNYEELAPFEEKYMSGFFGEIYNDSADALEERAKVKVEEDVEKLLRNTLSGYSTLTPDRKDIKENRNGVHFSLLPVWHYLYKYQEKDYDFYINGQNGKIVGSTPVSKKKVLAYGGTVFAATWMALSLILGIIGII